MKFKKEDLTIKAISNDSGYIESQSVEALLLFEILKTLQKGSFKEDKKQ